MCKCKIVPNDLCECQIKGKPDYFTNCLGKGDGLYVSWPRTEEKTNITLGKTEFCFYNL